MKKYLITILLLFATSTAIHAAFQENYPATGAPVASSQLRTNLDQLWVNYQQLTNSSFYPTINGMTIAYSGGKICSGSDGNVYTMMNGVLDFSTYGSGSILYVSVIVSGGAATFSIDTGAYNPAGIPLWSVSVGAASITITSDNRAWVNNSISLPFTTSGILKASSGTIGAAVTGTDYLPPKAGNTSVTFRNVSGMGFYGNGSGLTGITGAVSSVFSRTGAVVAQSGDYTAAQVGAVPTSAEGTANGVATLNSSLLVVQNPANATATPTASKISIADANGTLNSWITNPTTICLSLSGGTMTGPIKARNGTSAFGNISGAFYGNGSGLTGIKSTYYILIQDQKTSGTAGGTFTSGAWYTRTLNTIVNDDTGSVTLNNNTTVSIPAGTYRYRVSAPAEDVLLHKARMMIKNAAFTKYTTIGYGTSEYTNGTVTTSSIVTGTFSTTVAQRIKIQHRCSSSVTTNGMGYPSSFGVKEIYTTLELWK